MKSFDLELTSGSVARSVWKLAWPAVALNLVNGLHGFVDHILVGHYLGYTGNAAVGVAWQLFLVAMVFVSSLFHGMAVLVSRYAGRQNREAVGDIVYHTCLGMGYTFLILAVPAGLLLPHHLLPLVNAKPEVQVQALPYLRILFTCSAPLFFMIVLTNAMQAAGDPRTPLKLGILATVLNMAITALLITGAGPLPALGTVAPALGTTLAPLVSVVIAFILMARGKVVIPLPKTFTLKPDWSILRTVVRIGFPSGTQAVLLNVGGVILLAFVGSLEQSEAAQAAYVICYSQLFSIVTWASFGLRAAAATMMGQNLGADRPDRGKAAVYLVVRLAFIWAFALGAIFWFFPLPLLALFDATEEPVVSIGATLLRYLAVSGVFVASALAFTGGLQGAGDTTKPMWIALITQIFVLLGFCTLMRALGLLSPQTIWFAILLSHFTRFLLSFLAFQTGRWAHIRVELEH